MLALGIDSLKLSYAYVLTIGSSHSEKIALSSNDKQEVATFLLSLDVTERDWYFVNEQIGSEWLFDNHVSFDEAD